MTGIFQKFFGSKNGRLPTVPAPSNYPDSKMPEKPKVRGLNEESRKAAFEDYHLKARAHFFAIAKFQRERREKAGILKYKWISIPGACCEVGATNNGRIYSSTEPPAEGHPAEGKCLSKDWCRCIAAAVVSGFE